MDGIISSASLHRVLSKDVSYQEGELTLSSGDFTSSDGEPAQHLQEHHNSRGGFYKNPHRRTGTSR
jgi:hypothetical protein